MFKTIDTFSLEECKEYLATNPNSKRTFLLFQNDVKLLS